MLRVFAVLLPVVIFNRRHLDFDRAVAHRLIEPLRLLWLDPPQLRNPGRERTDLVADPRIRTFRHAVTVPIHDAVGRRVPQVDVLILTGENAVELLNELDALAQVELDIVLIANLVDALILESRNVVRVGNISCGRMIFRAWVRKWAAD